MSTRHADGNGPFRQERFASSPEYERGLLANLVARRCSMLDDKADRELIWAIHYFSHQEGGLKKLATGLLAKFADRIGTRHMVQIRKAATKNYSADEVRKVRADFPARFWSNFRLRGETKRELGGPLGTAARLSEKAEMSKELMALAKYSGEEMAQWQRERVARRATHKAREREEAASYPASYPVGAFINACLEAAKSGEGSLEKELQKLCLDPAIDILVDAGSPWYFADLIPAFRQYLQERTARRNAGTAVTSLGEIIHEALDYTIHAKTMTLAEGHARIGKSFSARNWCESHPGQARFVEVPPGNDDVGFFRALARGIGLGSFQRYKAVELRERVESVLLTGDLLLCLDEGQRIWPQANARFGYPKRVEWVMSMANAGVPICLICTPQFLERQNLFAQFKGWNSAQFMGRLGDYKQLPAELSLEDLMAVAKAVLPEADAKTQRALAAYARTSARYLAAIDAIAKRARYLAGRSGRAEATTEDVRTAMQQSVIPSDSNLVRAIEKTKTAHRKNLPAPAQPQIGREVQDKTPLSSGVGRMDFSRQSSGAVTALS